MSDNYVNADNINTSSIIGGLETNASIDGIVSGDTTLGDIEVGGIIIEQHPEILPATTDRLGGVIVGDHLSVTETGLLSVIVAQSPEGDNTNPISASALYMEVGYINALLGTI